MIGRERTGKVVGGALAVAQAVESLGLDLLDLLAALAVEVGKVTGGLGDGVGEAAEL